MQLLDKVVVPVVQRLGARNAWFDYGDMFWIIQGGLWQEFYDCLRDWVSCS